mgnify:CR=1 FL=1
MILRGWFQAGTTCPGVKGAHTYPSDGTGDCLLTLVRNELRRSICDEIGDIIRRLYPDLACRCALPNFQQMVHFNNRAEVTRDMVEKVLHTWEMETDVYHHDCSGTAIAGQEERT